MKIEIKLKDPKYCNGCPLIGEPATISGNLYRPIHCVFGYDIRCNFAGSYIDRPQKCIDDNGE